MSEAFDRAEFMDNPQCLRCHRGMALSGDREWPEDPRLLVCDSCIYEVAEELISSIHAYRESLMRAWRRNVELKDARKYPANCASNSLASSPTGPCLTNWTTKVEGSAKKPQCPQCNGKLLWVRQGASSMLNSDQFDSVRAGDWYCQTCPDNGRGNDKLCYWWDREVKQKVSNEFAKKMLENSRKAAEEALRAEFDPPPPDSPPRIRELELEGALEEAIGTITQLRARVAELEKERDEIVANSGVIEYQKRLHVAQFGLKELRAQNAALSEQLGIFTPVIEELDRAISKFPTWPTDPIHALAVLQEEVGELTKEVVQRTYESEKTSFEAIRKEATQVAAMALRFVASLDKYEYLPQAQHTQAALAKAQPAGK